MKKVLLFMLMFTISVCINAGCTQIRKTLGWGRGDDSENINKDEIAETAEPARLSLIEDSVCTSKSLFTVAKYVFICGVVAVIIIGGIVIRKMCNKKQAVPHTPAPLYSTSHNLADKEPGTKIVEGHDHEYTDREGALFNTAPHGLFSTKIIEVDDPNFGLF
jgi:hypothetical protein